MKAPLALAMAVLLLAFASPARAGTQVTPPVHNDTDRVGCVVQNLGPKPAAVTATLRDFNGAAIDSYSATIPPGTAFELVFTAAFQPQVYCEFEGTGRKVRGFLGVEPYGGATTALVLPAD